MAETATPATPTIYHDTLAPEAISDELAPVIAELGLENNCRELTEQGWTVVEEAATPEFNERLRQKILELTGAKPETGGGGGNMLLAKDSVFAEAVMNPKLIVFGNEFVNSRVGIGCASRILVHAQVSEIFHVEGPVVDRGTVPHPCAADRPH